MLKLNRPDYDSLRRHGEETYPHECCGILLGRMDDDGTRTVTSTARCGDTPTQPPAAAIPVPTPPIPATTSTQRNWCGSSAKAASEARTSSASTTPIPTTPPGGRRPTSPRPTGLVAPTSSPAWKKGRQY